MTPPSARVSAPTIAPPSLPPSKRQEEDRSLLEAIRKMQLLSEGELEALEHRSRQRGIAEQLLREGVLTDVQIAQLRAQLHGWHTIDLDNTPVDSSLLAHFPLPFLETQRLVPFAEKNGTLHVACETPDRQWALRLLQKKYQGPVQSFLATEHAILVTLSRVDRNLEQVSHLLLEQHAAATGNRENDHSIIELVDALLLHALRSNASDIHIEPWELEAQVRERIDGMLHRHLTFSKEIHALVVARIKVLSKLAIDEHNAPQDGKLLYRSPDGEHVDVRVSTTPTTHGEKVVLRLLVSQGHAIPLESLGLTGSALTLVEAEEQSAWGMILVTGPTGSGKTTTQYALLRRMNREVVNIATIEDPVEYDLPGVNQVQVNEKAGVTFSTGLRSIVRQDPNIILVGEIRDLETADICINAAMTGHLVLSTLHTNDAATAIPRLSDMHVEPFLISSTVNLIVAQRLVRKICMRCRESIPLEKAANAAVIHQMFGKRLSGKTDRLLYHGMGCSLCHNTGYVGRIGIFEVLKMTDAIRERIMRQENASTIRTAAMEAGMTSMVEDGLQKALEGITTIDEVLRVMRS